MPTHDTPTTTPAPTTEPVAELIPTASGHHTEASPWVAVRDRLRSDGPGGSGTTFWLAAAGPDGRPHVRPVLGVWVDDRLHVASGDGTGKARLVAADPRVSISAELAGLDLVLEGTLSPMDDPARLHRVADAYAATYGWQPTVEEGRLAGVEGAPTAGPPPYRVLALTVERAFAFPQDETLSPTRWTFPAP